jgi:hypothetical protein
LLDPPSVTGLPPGQISRIALRRHRGRRLIAVVAAAAVALFALAGIAIALPSPHGPAPAPIITALPPFPSLMATSSQPEPTASPHGGQPTGSPMPSMSTMPATTAPATPSSAMTTAPVTASPSTAATQPTVTVTYLVVSQWYDGFLGEVTVVNTGSSAISGWQIAVDLPYDQFTSVSPNASGYANNHILLLQPATYGDSVPADGTLSVFFTAYGTQTAPELCAFNSILCGLVAVRAGLGR